MFFRDIFSGKNYKIRTSAANKVVVITGANSGLGKEAARLLAIKNATVVMACRDMEKCEKVNVNISNLFNMIRILILKIFTWFI